MMDKRLSDRLMRLAPCFVCLLVIFTVAAAGATAPPVVEIGSRRELFVVEFIIDTLQGAQLRLHHQTPREVAITYDAPNEGNTSSYVRVFADGDRFSYVLPRVALRLADRQGYPLGHLLRGEHRRDPLDAAGTGSV